MIHEIEIPHLGANIDDGRVSAWAKNVGDFVETLDVLCSYETTKATFEIEAERAGYLLEILHADEVVPVLTVIGYLGDRPNEKVSDRHDA